MVVSQPSFVYERGDRYLQLVPEERHDALYAFRTLRRPASPGRQLGRAGDAPRRSRRSRRRSTPDRLRRAGRAARRSIRRGGAAWWTAGAARAAFLEGERGSIRPGLRADLALLPAEALSIEPEGLRSLSVRESGGPARG